MLPYSTLRNLFRIPWIRKNREAAHYLNNMFYLLIALYRKGRMQEYYIVRNLFFEMFDSFSIYGRSQARDAINDMLEIPWFQHHHMELYRLIATFKHITLLLRKEESKGDAAALQRETNKYVEEFIKIFKTVNNFNHRDEARIDDLLSRPDLMNVLMSNLLADLDGEHLEKT
jgi:hypothetical protein